MTKEILSTFPRIKRQFQQKSASNLLKSRAAVSVKENTIPGQCFQSVSLPVDARVSDKLREKIWKDEFIDFGCLLANPVLANRFQLTVQNAASGPLPSICIEPIARKKKR